MWQRLTKLSDGILRAERLALAFDQTEYVLGLVEADGTLGPEASGEVWPDPRRYWFRRDHDFSHRAVEDVVMGAHEQVWVDAGLFDGSAERLQSVKAMYDDGVLRGRLRPR